MIPDTVRDARKVLNDSPCAFWAFPAALSSTSLIMLLMIEDGRRKGLKDRTGDNKADSFASDSYKE